MRNKIYEQIQDLENSIDKNSGNLLKRFSNEFYYNLGSIFTQIQVEDAKIVNNLGELKKILESDNYSPFYYILYLAAFINSYNLRKIDKCGSFYVDTRPCSEDCAFCPLSRYHYSNINVKNIPWENIPQKIYDFAHKIHKLGVRHFKTVTTGAKSDPRIVPYISEGVRMVKKDFPDMTICISEGTLEEDALKILKNSGVDIFNNNLESSRKYFKKIVSTHNYDDKINAIKTAKALGFKICSGGLFGIGEDLQDRIELFLTLRDLDVDSSPFNIFVPFDNLPITKKLKKSKIKLKKAEFYYSIALYRIINPKKRLIIGAGRDEYLTTEEQKFALLIGANAIASSGYLSKEGILHTSEKDDKIFNEVLGNK